MLFRVSIIVKIIILIALLHLPLMGTDFENNPSISGNLIKVDVNSIQDADFLNTLELYPLIRLPQAFIVMTDNDNLERIQNSRINYQIISNSISLSQIAVDHNREFMHPELFQVIYQQDYFRLLQADPQVAQSLPFSERPSFHFSKNIKIEYDQPIVRGEMPDKASGDLNLALSLMSTDSMESYVNRLQAYYRRPIMSDSLRACTRWLHDKFTEFGYDSILYDTFSTPLYNAYDSSVNVLAVKPGTVLPEYQIVIGAHYDGVQPSPAADDNGSGTAAVLEMARVLKDIPTNMTYIFILFDAEEVGLLGSKHYAEEAAARGDNIYFMLNLDMIANKQNSTKAGLYHGGDQSFIALWDSIGAALYNMEGVNEGMNSHSDHHSFVQNGFDVLFVMEYNFSDVYHTAHDSTTYMSFSYMANLVKVSMATAFTVSESYRPFTSNFNLISGTPDLFIPAEETEFEFTVSLSGAGTLVPASGQIRYRVDGGEYASQPMTEIAANHYLGALTFDQCYSIVEYYFTVEEVDYGSVYETYPDAPHQAFIAKSKVDVLIDNFQYNKGWTVNGDASTGTWQRGYPAGGGDLGDPPSDYDGSGYCYLTGNYDGDSDVDFGATNLVSPAFDLSYSNAEISYARWYSNNYGYYQEDTLFVYISNDLGSSWTLVETVGPQYQATGGWYTNSFWVDEYIATTDQMLLRFEASDYGVESIVEAAIDAVTIRKFTCADVICGDANADASVNVSDAVYIINYVFNGGDEPIPYIAGEVNCDGLVNVSDAVYIINYVFTGGGNPCDWNSDGIQDCNN